MNQASRIALVAHPSAEVRRRLAEEVPVAGALADELADVCVHAEQHLQFAVRSRQEQQVAFLRLCDRGWPEDSRAEGVNAAVVERWLAAWAEMVALPLRVWKPHDLLTRRRVRAQLELAEGRLRGVLPSGIWAIVDPLDDTGRATLAYVLQAFALWHEANTRCLAAARIKEALVLRFREFGTRARGFGLVPPDAPLDLDAWRVVAADARVLAEQEQWRRRHEVPSGEYPIIS